MSRFRGVLPVLLALLIGLVGSVIAYRWIQTQARQVVPVAELAPAPGEETVEIVVAKESLAWGSKLTPALMRDNLTMRPYLKESLPSGHFDVLNDVQDRVLVKQVIRGQPVLESDLAPADVRRGGVGALIRPGFRAMTVRADCEFGATGFIDPGDRVDVLLTIDDRETRQAVTKIVLENVVVLATGGRVGQRREDADPDAGRVSGRDESYTLEVSPEDGEKLALASSRGRLHLAMRNVLDHDEVLTRGATVRGTLASYLDVAPEPEKPRVVRKAPPRPRVEVIKGTQVSTTTF